MITGRWAGDDECGDAIGAQEAAHRGNAHIHAAIQSVLPDPTGTHLEASPSALALAGGGNEFAVAGDCHPLTGDGTHVSPPRV